MMLNVHPAYHSTLRYIQLLAVVKCNVLKQYGFNAVFEPAATLGTVVSVAY